MHKRQVGRLNPLCRFFIIAGWADCRHHREYFGNTREVFSVTVEGEVLYIVTSLSDVQLMYKEPKLSFNAVISSIMGDFGCTPDTLQKMFDKEGKLKHWMDVSHDDFTLQMHPGDKFKTLNVSFLRHIESWMHWDRITGFSLISQSPSKPSKTVSLWKWYYTVLCDSATRSIFGDAIFQASPDLLENFYTFDEKARSFLSSTLILLQRLYIAPWRGAKQLSLTS